MTETETITTSDLIIPDTDALGAVTARSAEGARDRIAEAIETIAEAADQGDLVRAVTTLQHADNQVAQLQDTIQVTMQATHALHQVAVTLQAQRDEVTGQRDEARQFARRAWDEGLNHIFECGDCYMSMQEYILDAFTEERSEDVDWFLVQLRKWGETALADEFQLAADAIGDAIARYNALLERVEAVRQAHPDRPKPHVEPDTVEGVEPMDENAYDDTQMSGALDDWDEECDDPDEFDEEESEADDDSISPDE